MLSPLASFRADVLGGAAPLAEDEAMWLTPFALHAVVAPDFRRATLEQVSHVVIAVQGELHRPVAIARGGGELRQAQWLSGEL